MIRLILEEHRDKCEKEERFEEAALARDRIKKLKKIENRRNLEDLKNNHKSQLDYLVSQFEDEQAYLQKLNLEELSKQNEIKDSKMQELKNAHNVEEENFTENFLKNYPQQPKFSSEVLNLQKMMDGYIKNQEYEKANETKIKILTLCEQQDSKHNLEIKQKKLEKELLKLRSKHKVEMDSLMQRQNLLIREIEIKHKKEFEKLIYKQNNKLKELNIVHQGEINNQNNINKRYLNSSKS